ncbi:MAG: hypothetical protein KC917_10690, partial [Candidatus Omnitrophica bacterium]|nr:hypothetical protein [Candidatus Omnitrophota bacterium]
PYREAGAGTNFAKTGGEGRNSPHFFGGGLMEMIAIQNRQKMLKQMDPNQDGWIALAEMNGATIEIVPTTGADPIVFGHNGDTNGDGKPDLNRIHEFWYVDSAGKRIPSATSLNSEGVAGYNFWPVFWGWGEFNNGLNPSNRVFYHDPFFSHGGLPAFDPTTNEDPDGDGLTGISNAGAQQVFSHPSPEKGMAFKLVKGSTVCLDDIDHDGCLEEITEGDLDMCEWFILNAPPPALGRQTLISQHGRELMDQIGCTECHVPDWYIEPSNPEAANPHDRFAGDRRFFHVDVIYSDTNERLEGSLVDLTTEADGVHTPRRGGFLVKNIFTDFKHHDVGVEFYQNQFDGSLITDWRTAPLWGVGSSGPWGHDGADFSIWENIVRHGGEAQDSVDQFKALSNEDQEAVVAFLHSLVLYQVEVLPCDIDGDGTISENFMVGGKNVGTERLNAEHLFNTPVIIEGEVTAPDGTTLVSHAVLNIDEAYGQNLEWIADSDNDGWPDKIDERPNETGYLDGVHNIPVTINSDLNGDGAIDGQDLLLFQGAWMADDAEAKSKMPVGGGFAQKMQREAGGLTKIDRLE